MWRQRHLEIRNLKNEDFLYAIPRMKLITKKIIIQIEVLNKSVYQIFTCLDTEVN